MLPNYLSSGNCVTVSIVFLSKRISKLLFIILHSREWCKIKRHEKIKNSLIKLFFIPSVKNQNDPSKPFLGLPAPYPFPSVLMLETPTGKPTVFELTFNLMMY